MPLYTYKEMGDDILNDMDSDPSDSLFGINSTEEARQVAQIIKTTYFQIIDGRDWPHLYKLFQLTQTGAATPTHMTIPTNVMDFDYIKYNSRTTTDTRDKSVLIKYVKPLHFMNLLDARDSSATNVDVITDPISGVPLNINNNIAPSCWTSFDDQTVVFDAYDSGIDTTNLLTTKTQARGKVYPTVTDDDDFVFDLPVDAFSYLLSEAKSVCFLAIKQASNPKAEQQSNTQRRRMSNEAHKITQDIMYKNFGRRGKR